MTFDFWVKRFFDFMIAFFLLLLFSPFLIFSLSLIWLSERHSPFFWARRVGYKGTLFHMLKIRTMFWNADQSCSLTPRNDQRITPIGRWLRLLKVDELPQLWNVLTGEMSLVGPRPDVYEGGVSLYTTEEKIILDVKPGMIDLASLFFSNEGDLLARFSSPKEDYYRLLFPLKKKLMVFYVTHQSFWLDIQILYGTLLLLFSRKKVIRFLANLLIRYQAPPTLIKNYHDIIQEAHTG